MLLLDELELLIPALDFSKESRLFSPKSEVELALHDLLASAAFSKAPRLRRIMHFLADLVLQDRGHEIHEHASAIVELERDSQLHFSDDDPAAWWQLDLLRSTLKAYYAEEGRHSAWRFYIPQGSLIPEVRPVEQPSNDFMYQYRLALSPLTASDAAGQILCAGLSAELGRALLQQFGKRLMSHSIAGVHDNMNESTTQVSHLLRGQLSVENDQVTVLMELTDTYKHSVAWSEHFDWDSSVSQNQSELAGAIAHALRVYFSEV